MGELVRPRPGTALRGLTLAESEIDFLDKLQATGYAAGGTTSLPTIDFGKTQMMNRVDNNNDGALEMYKYRVSSISTETGATITVTYLGADCVAGTSMPAAADANTRRCFPMYWTRDGATRRARRSGGHLGLPAGSRPTFDGAAI